MIELNKWQPIATVVFVLSLILMVIVAPFALSGLFPGTDPIQEEAATSVTEQELYSDKQAAKPSGTRALAQAPRSLPTTIAPAQGRSSWIAVSRDLAQVQTLHENLVRLLGNKLTPTITDNASPTPPESDAVSLGPRWEKAAQDTKKVRSTLDEVKAAEAAAIRQASPPAKETATPPERLAEKRPAPLPHVSSTHWETLSKTVAELEKAREALSEALQQERGKAPKE